MSALAWVLLVVAALALLVGLFVWRLVWVSNHDIEEMRLLRDVKAERRIEWMLREGFSVRRVSREMGVSCHTVRTVLHWMEQREAKLRR